MAGKQGQDRAVLDRSLDVLIEGLERRAEAMERTLAAVAVELRGVQERQQTIRHLLEAVAAKQQGK